MALELTSLICELHCDFVIAILEGIVVVGAVLGSWGKVNGAVNDMSHGILSYVTLPVFGLIWQVMEMLSHINKRVKDQASIKLPLKELLALYQSPDLVSMVKNFALVYIEMAIDRAPWDEQKDVLDALLSTLAKAPAQHQEVILRLAAKGLDQSAGHNTGKGMAGTFMKDAANCEIFLAYCLQILLFQPPMISPDGTIVPPPGLSLEQAKQVQGKQVLKGEVLNVRKLGVLNYLGELELPADSVYPLYLVAASDGNERVSRRGEELLKRKASSANLEDLALIKQLFALFQGTAKSKPHLGTCICTATFSV